MDYPDTTEEVDLLLRHVARQFPQEFAQALFPPGTEVRAAGWVETQVTSRQRRLDRVLDVTANGQRSHEHLEWQLRMTPQVSYRMFEYHILEAMSLAAATPAGALPPPIRSTLVLLSGREEPWPDEGEYRTSPVSAPFSGVTYRIDAVYQRTVDELLARESTLWLIFTPLAVDADGDGMARVIARLRAEVPLRERNELIGAMLLMADTDRRRRGLKQVILPLLHEEKYMESWLYKQGEAKGIEKGIEKGIAKGIDKGIETGRARAGRKAVALLYETRFGPMPAELRAKVDATEDADRIERWCELVARSPKEEVDAALSGNGH